MTRQRRPRPLHPSVTLHLAEQLMRPVIPMDHLGKTPKGEECWGELGLGVEVVGKREQMMLVAAKKRENATRQAGHAAAFAWLPIWC